MTYNSGHGTVPRDIRKTSLSHSTTGTFPTIRKLEILSYPKRLVTFSRSREVWPRSKIAGTCGGSVCKESQKQAIFFPQATGIGIAISTRPARAIDNASSASASPDTIDTSSSLPFLRHRCCMQCHCHNLSSIPRALMQEWKSFSGGESYARAPPALITSLPRQLPEDIHSLHFQ